MGGTAAQGAWVVVESHIATKGYGSLLSAVRTVWSSRYSSETSARNSIRKKLVQLNGLPAKASSPVVAGDTLFLRARRPRDLKLHENPQAQTPAIPVLYEDEHLACVNKPRGLISRGSGATRLEPWLPSVLVSTTLPGALGRPTPAHRLDAPTGGLLMVAKTHDALSKLGTAFASRRVQKSYIALVWGELAGSGDVFFSLDGKDALTRYRALSTTAGENYGSEPEECKGLARFLAVTTVELDPATGRMHQLRRHMALIGHPIVGDTRYTSGYASQRAKNLGPEACSNEAGWRRSGAPEIHRSRAVSPAAIQKAMKIVPGFSDGLFLWSIHLAMEHPVVPDKKVDVRLQEPRQIEDAHQALREWTANQDLLKLLWPTRNRPVDYANAERLSE